jgi:hypothetical protein
LNTNAIVDDGKLKCFYDIGENMFYLQEFRVVEKRHWHPRAFAFRAGRTYGTFGDEIIPNGYGSFTTKEDAEKWLVEHGWTKCERDKNKWIGKRSIAFEVRELINLR